MKAHRKYTDQAIFLATSNIGKIKEITALLSPFAIDVISAEQYNITPPEETADTFLGNAILKAQYYSKYTTLPALADDSGLSIAALNNEPGIFSSRWANDGSNFDLAMDQIEEKLKMLNLNESPAFFTCALALCWSDGHIESFEGRIDGKVIFPRTGKFGFGYDPIFLPQGYDLTFAEMDSEFKAKISHRAIAFQKLVEGCFNA